MKVAPRYKLFLFTVLFILFSLFKLFNTADNVYNVYSAYTVYTAYFVYTTYTAYTAYIDFTAHIAYTILTVLDQGGFCAYIQFGSLALWASEQKTGYPWDCKGTCHLRFSGIRPLRGYPPPLPP